jgi:hypothetical protein
MRSSLSGIASGIAALIALGGVAAAAGATTFAAPDPTPPAPARTAAPAPASSTTSAASQADARALFGKAVAALGGREKIAAVRDVRTRGQVSAQTGSGEMNLSMETSMIFPDRLAQQVDGPYGRFSMIATPAGAYILTDQGPKDLPVPMRDELLRQITRTAFFLVQKADDPKFHLALGGEETVGDVATRPLDVSYGDVSVRWFVDPATGRILRSAHDSTSPAGKTVRVVSDFSDFKTDDGGLTLPRRILVKTEAEPDQSVVLDEIKINPGVDPNLFVRPPAPTPGPLAKGAPGPTPAATAKPKP